LRVSQITGALFSAYTCVDVVHEGGAGFWRGGANIAYRMAEAITNKNFFRIRLFLIDSFPNLFGCKGLLAIGREIHNRASLRFAGQVFNALRFAQTHRQKGFDRLSLHGPAFLAADRASSGDAGRALKIRRGQLTNGVPGFGWTTTRVSH
jgi:hypothetical protein